MGLSEKSPTLRLSPCAAKDDWMGLLTAFLRPISSWAGGQGVAGFPSPSHISTYHLELARHLLVNPTEQRNTQGWQDGGFDWGSTIKIDQVVNHSLFYCGKICKIQN